MSIAIFKDVPLAAGASLIHHATGNTVVLTEATANLKIAINGGPFSHFAPGFHWQPFAKLPDGSFVDTITQIEIENPNAAAVTYTVSVAVGDLVDRAITFAGGGVNVLPVGGTLADDADLSVAATSTAQVVAATTGQRSVTVVNLPTNPGPVRLGANGTVGAARGLYLGAGQSCTIDTVSRVDCYNPNAAACVLTRTYIR